jgi:hypothetical protein
MMVATQSRFHRDRLDGEQIALKPLSFFSGTELSSCDANAVAADEEWCVLVMWWR